MTWFAYPAGVLVDDLKVDILYLTTKNTYNLDQSPQISCLHTSLPYIKHASPTPFPPALLHIPLSPRKGNAMKSLRITWKQCKTRDTRDSFPCKHELSSRSKKLQIR